MKRVLLFGFIAVALVGMLFAGLVLGLLVSPVRAQIGQVVNQVLDRANIDIRRPQVVAAQGSTPPQLQVKEEKGVLIAAVFVDGPADKAGLQRGDIILSIDGEAVNTQAELRSVLGSHKAGDTVELSVQHGDEQETVSVTLAEQPSAAAAQPDGTQGAYPAPNPSRATSLPFLGIVPSGANEWQSRKMGPGFVLPQIPENGQPLVLNGAPVIEVVAGSPAEKAGIAAGDTILSVDGITVDAQNTLPALITSHKPGDTVTLEVQAASGEKREVTATLGDNPNNEGTAWLGVSIGGTRRFRMDGIPMPGNPLPGLPEGSPIPGLPEGHPEINPGLPGFSVHPGAFIQEVTAGSPAEKAGLKAGQFIESVDGEELKSPDDLTTAVSSHKPGDTITLTVYEAGSTTSSQEITVTLGENPQKAGAAWLGIRFSFMNINPGQLPGESLQQG